MERNATLSNHNIRIASQDLMAERSVLSLEMLEPTGFYIQLARQILKPEDFYWPVHSEIHRAILAVADRNQVADSLSVRGELRARGTFNVDESNGGDEVTGNAREVDEMYFREVLGTVQQWQAYDVQSHAVIVAQCARRRRYVAIAERLLQGGYDNRMPFDDLYEIGSIELRKLLSDHPGEKNRPKSLKEHAMNIAEKYGRNEKPTRFIGIGPVDDMIGGVADGEMVVIGGQTSMGKTLCTMQWLHEAAAKGVSSMIISNEMPGESLATRVIPAMTNMEERLWSNSSGDLKWDIEKFYENKGSITVFDRCPTIADVERAVERGSREFKAEIVALDYVQLVKGDGQSREQQVGDVSRRFKQSLMKHSMIGLLLSQLNRESTKNIRTPVLSDLRDSGSIEQDADIVLFPYWEAKVNQRADPTSYRFYQAKNRLRGMKQTSVEMRIDPSKQWLYPLDDGFYANQSVPDNF